MREAREPQTSVGRVRREKKTDCPFSIHEFVPTRGLKNCRRAVKNLLATLPSLRIFSVSPQSRSLFSASFHLNTQKYGLFCSLEAHKKPARNPPIRNAHICPCDSAGYIRTSFCALIRRRTIFKTAWAGCNAG